MQFHTLELGLAAGRRQESDRLILTITTIKVIIEAEIHQILCVV